MRHVLVPTLIAAALVSAFAACNSTEGTNGQYCLKNDDCESKHCISNVCRPEPKFGGATPAPTQGGSGGDTGGSQDAGTD